jgi:hypothetical protein
MNVGSKGEILFYVLYLQVKLSYNVLSKIVNNITAADTSEGKLFE